MKKLLSILFSSLFGMLCIATLATTSVSLAQTTEDFPYDTTTQLNGVNETTDISTVVQSDALTPTNGIFSKLTSFFRVSGTSYNPDNTGSPALSYVKWIINILLGLVSFISLVLIIFAFYLIFFSKGEDAVTKAKKILTGVAIALGIMGVSRLIVSYFFNIFTTTT